MPQPTTDRRRAELAQAAGNVAMSRAEYSTARQWFEEALTKFRALEDRRGEADSLRLLGELGLATGDSAAALSWYREAYDTYVTVGEPTLADDCREKAGIARTPETPAENLSGEHLFVKHSPLIESVVRSVARRVGLVDLERQDFSTYVAVRMIEDDYAALTKFQGRASLRTYLTVVVKRFYYDYRIRMWGKWRPSLAAKKLGTTAILLEQLIDRDGLTAKEAMSLASVRLSGMGKSVSEAELEAIIAALPGRFPRRVESEDALSGVPASEDPQRQLAEHDRAAMARAVRNALEAVLADVSVEDRVILAMRVEDNRSVAEIAKALNLDQKVLYRRVEWLLLTLRNELQKRGISADDATELLVDTSL